MSRRRGRCSGTRPKAKRRSSRRNASTAGWCPRTSRPGNRLDDGAVAPAGRRWSGSMDDGEKAPTGAFYCFADGRLTRTHIDNIAITNGPAVSPDGRVLYLVDTLKGTIECTDIRED